MLQFSLQGLFSTVFAAGLLSGVCENALCEQLDWKVVNRFPVFSEATDFERIETSWKHGDSPTEFIASQTSSTLRDLLPIDRTLWNPADGTYDKRRLFAPTHMIRIVLRDASPDQMCDWKINNHAVGRSLCSVWSPPFEVDDRAVFSVSATRQNNPPVALANQRIDVDLILGLGDSYSSGEENPDRPVTFTQAGGKAR